MAMDENQSSLYKKDDIYNTYVLVSGSYILPVAENPPTDTYAQQTWTPTVVVKAFADYRIRNVTYKASKEYQPPFIPQAADSGVFKFLGGTVTIPFPVLNTAAGFYWQVQTDYSFVENAYIDPNLSGYILGQVPFVYALQDDISNAYSQSANNAPPSIQQAGIGPRLGFNSATNLDFNNSYYFYSEPSYFPAQFFSVDLVNAPQSYQ